MRFAAASVSGLTGAASQGTRGFSAAPGSRARSHQSSRPEQVDFLYANTGAGNTITLRSGVAFCFRKFHPLISNLVRGERGRSGRYLRQQNLEVLGESADLNQFLFGGERAALAVVRPVTPCAGPGLSPTSPVDIARHGVAPRWIPNRRFFAIFYNFDRSKSVPQDLRACLINQSPSYTRRSSDEVDGIWRSKCD